MLQTKEQHKSLETNLNEKEISGLIDMKFKIIKMLIEVRRERHKQNKNFNKDKENVLKSTKQKF